MAETNSACPCCQYHTRLQVQEASPPQPTGPSPSDQADEPFVRELWQEVRDFCDGCDFEQVAMPLDPIPEEYVYDSDTQPPVSFQELLEMNKIRMSVSRRLSPQGHFGQLGNDPTYTPRTLTIDENGVQAEVRELQSFKAVDNFYSMVQEVFFPRQRLRDSFFRLNNARLSVDSLHLQRVPHKGVITQTPSQLPEDQAKRTRPGPAERAGGRMTESIQSKARRGGGVSTKAGTHTLTSARATTREPSTKAGTHNLTSARATTREPSVLQAVQVNILPERLQPHLSYWLTCDDQFVSGQYRSLFKEHDHTGLRLPSLICPYFTIAFAKPGEDIHELEGRVAVIATHLLSTHIHKLNLTNTGNMVQLRHYAVTITDWEFALYRTAPELDGKGGYEVSIIDAGSLTSGADCLRFGQWIDKVHEWAMKVWKPTVTRAIDPDHQIATDIPKADEAVNEAAQTTGEWSQHMTQQTRKQVDH